MTPILIKKPFKCLILMLLNPRACSELLLDKKGLTSKFFPDFTSR